MNSKKIDDYFDNVSTTYQSKTKKFPWSFLRNLELNAIKKVIPNVQDKNIVEYGCGAGFYTNFLYSKNPSSIIAVDSVLKMINQLPQNKINTVNTDCIDHLQELNTNNINTHTHIIFAAGLLEFITSPSIFLKLSHRAIEDNGSLVLLVPQKSILSRFYSNFHKKNGIHISILSSTEWLKLFKETGWVVYKEKAILSFSKAICLRKKS